MAASADISRHKHGNQQDRDGNRPSHRKPDEGYAVHPRPMGAARGWNSAQGHLSA
jgi:hypothetical protein